MRCPFCGHDDTQVKDLRPTEDHAAIRRRRYCPACGARWTTFERVHLRELTVIKKNGERTTFDREKLLRSLRIALRKRPVDDDRIERVVNSIQRRLETLGESRSCRRSSVKWPWNNWPSSIRWATSALPPSIGISARPRISRISWKASVIADGGGSPADDMHEFMQTALSLAKRGLGQTWPNPTVGCLIVRDGQPVGRGWTQPGGVRMRRRKRLPAPAIWQAAPPRSSPWSPACIMAPRRPASMRS